LRVDQSHATLDHLSTDCWSSVDRVSTEYQSGCRSRIDWDFDQGYRSRVSIDTQPQIPFVQVIRFLCWQFNRDIIIQKINMKTITVLDWILYVACFRQGNCYNLVWMRLEFTTISVFREGIRQGRFKMAVFWPNNCFFRDSYSCHYWTLGSVVDLCYYLWKVKTMNTRNIYGNMSWCKNNSSNLQRKSQLGIRKLKIHTVHTDV